MTGLMDRVARLEERMDQIEPDSALTPDEELADECALEVELAEVIERMNAMAEDAVQELREAYERIAALEAELAAERERREAAERLMRYIAASSDTWDDDIDDHFARYKD